MIYACCNENRKSAVLENASLNGIDYLEVLDHDAIALDSPRQRTLLVHCLKAAPSGLTPDNVLIQGGESITHITVQWLAPASSPPPLLTNAAEQSYFPFSFGLNVQVSGASAVSPTIARLSHSSPSPWLSADLLYSFMSLQC